MAKPQVLFIFSDPTTQWKPLQGAAGTTGLCTPDMALVDDGNGDVTLNGQPSTPFIYKGKSYPSYPAATATLTVQKGRQPKFAFSVVGSGSNSYFLNGVALKNQTAAGPGGTTFPDLDIKVANDGTTTLNLQDINPGAAGSTTSFDMLILVQDRQGNVGLIDPLLTNDN